jgi:hypothetical protein
MDMTSSSLTIEKTFGASGYQPRATTGQYVGRAAVANVPANVPERPSAYHLKTAGTVLGLGFFAAVASGVAVTGVEIYQDVRDAIKSPGVEQQYQPARPLPPEYSIYSSIPQEAAGLGAADVSQFLHPRPFN